MALIDQMRYEWVKFNKLTNDEEKNKILIAVHKLASIEKEIVESKAIINIRKSETVLITGLYLERHDMLEDQIKELLQAQI